MAGSTYDLVVVGSGTAAMVGTMKARNAGWSVAVADYRPYGGTCALRGCDPKKMLLSGATVEDHARRMKDKGIDGAVRIDWPELMAFKRSFTDPIPQKHEERYKEMGIDTFNGCARFTGPASLSIGDTSLAARRILLATGAEPVDLGIAGQDLLGTHEDFLRLPSVPGRLILIGGGYISAEFSHLAARAGAKVTILQRGDRLLPGFDPDLVGWLMERFVSLGIDVRTRTRATSVSRSAGAYRVWASSSTEDFAVDGDVVIHAAGRAPALAALGLEAAGVELEDGKLKLNDYLQSVTNANVYAAGDAAAKGPPLTPVSSHDARVAVANMLEGNHRKPDYRGTPSVAFTIPPIARVGLSEAEAQARGLRVRVRTERTSNWFTARQAAESVYGYKTIVDETTDEVLGAHIVGPHADEVINVFALAIRSRVPAKALKGTMFAYPTGASDIGYML